MTRSTVSVDGLFLWVYILKSPWVYNSNNYGNESDIKILLTYHSVTGWVATLIPIKSHWGDPMVIE